MKINENKRKMGVGWSAAKKDTYMGKQYIVVQGAFPSDKTLSEDLWNYYRGNKETIKKAGFILFKNPADGQWAIKYSTPYNAEALVKTGNDPKWKIDYRAKLVEMEKNIKESKAFRQSNKPARQTAQTSRANDFVDDGGDGLDLNDIQVNDDIPTN